MKKRFEYQAFFYSLIAIVLTIIYLLLTRCDKWDGCYDCNIHTEFLNVGPVIIKYDTILEYCDFENEEDVRYFEEINSYSNDNVIQEVKCIKK